MGNREYIRIGDNILRRDDIVQVLLEPDGLSSNLYNVIIDIGPSSWVEAFSGDIKEAYKVLEKIQLVLNAKDILNDSDVSCEEE